MISNGFKHVPICQININWLSAHVETTLAHFLDKRGIEVLALQEVKNNEPLDVGIFPGMSTFSVSSALGCPK